VDLLDASEMLTDTPRVFLLKILIKNLLLDKLLQSIMGSVIAKKQSVQQSVREWFIMVVIKRSDTGLG
jgi:hypothetical protein